MKHLGKKRNIKRMTVSAYACSCSCTGSCNCNCSYTCNCPPTFFGNLFTSIRMNQSKAQGVGSGMNISASMGISSGIYNYTGNA